jgi:hypothetical protein
VELHAAPDEAEDFVPTPLPKLLGFVDKSFVDAGETTEISVGKLAYDFGSVEVTLTVKNANDNYISYTADTESEDVYFSVSPPIDEIARDLLVEILLSVKNSPSL